jgi:hypothetical protein
MVGGRTAHSMFKIPVENLTDESLCAISKELILYDKHGSLFGTKPVPNIVKLLTEPAETYVMTIGFWWYFSSLWRRLSADPSYRQKRLL